MVLPGVIYRGKEQSHCGHYTPGVKVENTWFLISNKRILMQRKAQRSSKDFSFTYILIYEKITPSITPSILLNGTAEAGPTSEMITETAEIMIWQFVLQELVESKIKLTIVQREEKTDLIKVKSPVKRKPKFINCGCKENNNKMFMRDNVNDKKRAF